MKYIYSTLAADQIFTKYIIGADKTAHPATRFRLKGGAQLAHTPSITDFFVHTPLGVMTTCREEVYEWLQDDACFKHFLAHGFVRVEDSNLDVEKVAGQMELPTKEQGAPLTERDIVDPDHNGVSGVGDAYIKVIDEPILKKAKR